MSTFSWPSSVDPSVGPVNNPAPTFANEIGGVDVTTGDLFAYSATAPGTPGTILLTVQGNASGVPIPVSFSPSLLQNVNVTEWGSVATTLGQKVAASSIPTVLASDQITLLTTPLGGINTNTTGLNNTITAPNTPASSAITVQGNASGVPLPVSISSGITNPLPTKDAADGTIGNAIGTIAMLMGGSDGTDLRALNTDNTGKLNINNISGTVSLPNGAATQASLALLTLAQGSTTSGQSGPLMQAAVTTSAPTYTTGQTAPLSLTTGAGLRVDGSGTTQPVSGTVTANQGTANATPWNENIAQVGGSAVSLGQKAMASSIPVVLSSNQSAIPTSSSGNTPLVFARLTYSSTNVTTSAFVQVLASTPGITNVMEIFDSSGQTLMVGFGAAGFEVNQFIIYPGGNGRITVNIPASTRIAVKALSATANSGELDMNLYT